MVRIALALTVLAVAATTAAPASAAPLTFHPPQYIDESYAGGEPVLITDTVHHRILYSSHEGTTHIYRPGLPALTTFTWATEYRNQVKIWTSKDGGLTFQRASVSATGFGGDPSKNQGFSDPDWAMDASGRVYNTSINLASQALFSSGDGGETFDKGNPECRPGDRPWLAAAEKDHAFLATNAIDEGGVLNHRIFETKDGGTTCSRTGIPNKGAGYAGNGKLLYDHASKQLIEPTQWGSNGLGIATWKEGDAAFTPHQGVADTSIYAHWPAIAQDGAGTVYMVWDTNATADGGDGGCDGAATPAPNEILMMYTKDFGKTWSAPTAIARGNNTRVFWPWIAAGDAGKLSVVWYETNKVVDLACQQADISVKAATVLDATSDNREIVTADVAGRPIAEGVDICQSGTTCVATGEDRRLGDFFTNAIDERGCVIVGTGDVMKPAPGTEQTRHTSLPLFIRQATGPRIIGSGDCDGSAGSAAKPAAPGPVVAQPKPVGAVGKGCGKVRLAVKAPKGQRLAKVTVTVNGKKTKVSGKGSKRSITVDLRKIKGAKYKVKVVGLTGQGRRIVSTKTYKKKC